MNRFSRIEWSGPAWFQVVTDKNGWPVSFRLMYFYPLHLGDATTTEWDGGDFGKVYPKILKDNKIIRKCVQGNIHSHHSMGPSFSETDIDQLEDNAGSDTVWPSLVCSTSYTPYHFGFSYKDQFGQQQVYELAKDDIKDEIKVSKNNDWTKEANWIEKQKSKALKEVKKKNIIRYDYRFKESQNLFSKSVQKDQDDMFFYDSIIDAYHDDELTFLDAERKLKEKGMNLDGTAIKKI